MKRHGFTLIELLIVVAIIAILAAIAVPNFLEAQTRAKISRNRSDFRTMATAIEAYRVDANQYPPGFQQYSTPGDPNWIVSLNRLTSPVAYITSIPEDPFLRSKKGAFQFIYVYDFLELGPEEKDWKPTIITAYYPFMPQGTQWFLAGIGPDQSYESEGSMGVSDPPYKQYDATNGTISRGDIFRWGP